MNQKGGTRSRQHESEKNRPEQLITHARHARHSPVNSRIISSGSSRLSVRRCRPDRGGRGPFLSHFHPGTRSHAMSFLEPGLARVLKRVHSRELALLARSRGAHWHRRRCHGSKTEGNSSGRSKPVDGDRPNRSLDLGCPSPLAGLSSPRLTWSALVEGFQAARAASQRIRQLAARAVHSRQAQPESSRVEMYVRLFV